MRLRFVIAIGLMLLASFGGALSGELAGRAALPEALEVAYLPPASHSYAEALAAGLEVPENDPDLSFCTDDSLPDPGYASADDVENAGEPTEPECQADVRDGTVTVGALTRLRIGPTAGASATRSLRRDRRSSP